LPPADRQRDVHFGAGAHGAAHFDAASVALDDALGDRQAEAAAAHGDVAAPIEAFEHARQILAGDAGTAILLVSAELDEVMELSDRIAVMYRGELVALVDGPTANREEIGLLMATGGRKDVTEVAHVMETTA
jgi:hypothetical protein